MPRLYKYIRFSTDKQDAMQQENAIDRWLEQRKMVADERIVDEATSGYKTDMKSREFQTLLSKLEPNDMVIVSELSRITRKGASELLNVIYTWFKPYKIRLILCDYNLDIDCTDMNPFQEMMLSNMAVMARIERDQISRRTIEGLDARRKLKKSNGGWFNKDRKWVTGFGRSKGCDTSQASEAAAISHRIRKENDPKWRQAKGLATKLSNDGMPKAAIASALNAAAMTTRSGGKWNIRNVGNLLKD